MSDVFPHRELLILFIVEEKQLHSSVHKEKIKGFKLVLSLCAVSGSLENTPFSCHKSAQEGDAGKEEENCNGQCRTY